MLGCAVIGIAGMAATNDVEIEAAPLSPAMAALAIVATLPLWWRRRWPLSMVGALVAVVAVASAVDERGLYSMQLVIETMVLCFAVGAWSRRLGLAAGVLGALGLMLVAGAAADDTNVVAAGAYGVAGLAAPAVAGYATRTRRQYLAEVEQRLAEAERDRDERARRAVADERTRIARELHDVVAHHVSLIGVQAGAARRAIDRSPDATRDALEGIEAASRAAVGEMRQILDVLAPLGDEDARGVGAPAAPQPQLGQLDALVGRWRDAGVDLALTVEGDLDGIPPAASLCGYRIVEESLANLARHSRASRATISVEVGEVGVRIVIADPGPAVTPPHTDGSGRGIVGMRERVALFGGSLNAGRTPDGGYLVVAVVPRSTP